MNYLEKRKGETQVLQKMENISCCYITVLNIKNYLKCIHFRGLQFEHQHFNKLFDSSIKAKGNDSFSKTEHILQTTLTKITFCFCTQLSATEKELATRCKHNMQWYFITWYYFLVLNLHFNYIFQI